MGHPESNDCSVTDFRLEAGGLKRQHHQGTFKEGLEDS